MPPFIRAVTEGLQLSLKVQPRASRHEVVGPFGAELKIRVAAPPVDSAANDGLVEFLAQRLDCAKSAVRLVRGQTSTHKVVLISGMEAETVVKRLLGG